MCTFIQMNNLGSYVRLHQNNTFWKICVSACKTHYGIILIRNFVQFWKWLFFKRSSNAVYSFHFFPINMVLLLLDICKKQKKWSSLVTSHACEFMSSTGSRNHFRLSRSQQHFRLNLPDSSWYLWIPFRDISIKIPEESCMLE